MWESIKFGKEGFTIIPVCGFLVLKRKITADLAVILLEMVDLMGFAFAAAKILPLHGESARGEGMPLSL